MSCIFFYSFLDSVALFFSSGMCVDYLLPGRKSWDPDKDGPRDFQVQRASGYWEKTLKNGDELRGKSRGFIGGRKAESSIRI